MLKLGDIFPDFTADSSIGKMEFHNYLGDSWGILFSHPADYTPVCTSELGRAAELTPEFAKRNTKLVALSCDDAECHKKWIKDVQAYYKLGEGDFPFPIVSDEKRDLAYKLGMIDAEAKDAKGLPLTARSVFIIGPDKKMKLAILYPATTGRNFTEILRVLDSLQITATKPVATPADWKNLPNCEFMIAPTLSDEEAKKQFPNHVVHDMPSGKAYLRTTLL